MRAGSTCQAASDRRHSQSGNTGVKAARFLDLGDGNLRGAYTHNFDQHRASVIV